MKVSTRPSPKSPQKTPAKTAAGNGATSQRTADIVGVVLVLLAVVLLFALATARAGLVGQSLEGALRFLVGGGAWCVPFILFAAAAACIRGRSVAAAHLAAGLSTVFLAVIGFLATEVRGDYFDPYAIANGGGYIGATLGWLFDTLFGVAKPWALVALGLVGVVLCVDVPIRAMLAATGRGAKAVAAKTVTRPRNPAPAKPKPIVEPKPAAAPVPAAVAAPEPKEDPAKTRTPPRQTKTETAEPTLSSDTPVPKEGYQLPPTNLLAESMMVPQRSQAEMQRNIETLEGTLEQFGIEATVVEVANGPTVTRYEIQLGPGIHVKRITALADNIAMSLAASQVRVEAPIPGKNAIGVEVPNSTGATVTLRELCEDPGFRNHQSRLYTALGKDISGMNRYADLTRMPHILIGGATNSGKSIGLAALIMSLLMRNTPKDVRLVMIDPKRVELTLFDGIPHLMCPVIKDVREAPGLLRAVVREMDRRYDILSEAGVRNIDSWNDKATFQDRMPYIVVVVDELADLMIQAKAEIETIIVRIAQLARAVGIHLVLATQRPSVDVVTGIIKANVPSRVAFSVASVIDSRTILDQKGAESLIGKGDMLFAPIGAPNPVRIQGCYVSEKEIAAVCDFWRKQETPEYVLDPVEEAVADPRKEAGDFGADADPLFEDAVHWAAERGQASTSMLQRKFSIGFQRASRILDMMEERGFVGPQNGPRPRDVLVSLVDVDALLHGVPAFHYDVGRTIADEEAEQEARG